MDMLIDGIWTGASDGATDPVLNPATNAEIGSVPRATAADVERAIGHVALQPRRWHSEGISC